MNYNSSLLRKEKNSTTLTVSTPAMRKWKSYWLSTKILRSPNIYNFFIFCFFISKLFYKLTKQQVFGSFYLNTIKSNKFHTKHDKYTEISLHYYIYITQSTNWCFNGNLEIGFFPYPFPKLPPFEIGCHFQPKLRLFLFLHSRKNPTKRLGSQAHTKKNSLPCLTALRKIN